MKETEQGKENPYFNHLYANYHFNCFLRKENTLFLGTKGSGILIFNSITDKFEETDNPALPEKADIIFIRQHKFSNKLIIGTRKNGIFLFDADKGNTINYKDYGTEIRLIYQDNYWMFWYKSEKFGISRIDPLKTECKHFTLTPSEIQPVIDDERPFLYEDSRGEFWIGTHGGGLAWYDRNNDSFIFYRNVPNSPNTISSDFVHCITL